MSKLATRVRARGLREVAGLGLARAREAIASEETLAVLGRSTAPLSTASSGGLALRRLTAGDADRYAHAIGTDSRSTFRDRLSGFTRCYAVEDGERMVHASWVTTSCAWTRELRSFVCASAGDAYVYESFTRADARGRGVYPLALEEICRALAGEGIERLWVAVEGHNEPSLRAVAKAGFERVFVIRYARRIGRLAVEVPDEVKTDTSPGLLRKKRRIWLTRDGAI